MAFKYSDYLLTPSDIFRGVLYVLEHLRPVDIVGETVILLILIYTKQVLGWGIGMGLLLALPFTLIYWGNAPFWKAIRLIKNLHHFDSVGICAIIFIYIFTKLYFGWGLESIFFLIFLFVTFYWNLDPRILISFALIYLVACPFFFFLGNRFGGLQGEEWTEHAAIWTFYLLVFGIAKQVWSLRKEKVTEIVLVEARDPITETGLTNVFYEDIYERSLNIRKKFKTIFVKKRVAQIPSLVGSLSSPSYARAKENSRAERFLPQMVFFAIAYIIILPLFFQNGYLFLLDMVWGPNIQLSDYVTDGVTASYPLMLLLKSFALFLPTAFLQKTLLSLILYLCGYWMFNLSRTLMPRHWAILSGIFYMLNPYVFERLLAGQWLVLLGYAFFPLVIFRFLKFLESDKGKDLWIFVALFSIYPIFSPHWAYMAFWFLLLLTIIYLSISGGFTNLKKAEFSMMRKKIIVFVILQSLLWLIVNSFWLKKFWSADSVIGKITQNDFLAFSTAVDPVWGASFNVLSLYGFWQDRFFLPKDIFPYWWALTFIIIAFSIVGFIHLAKKKNVLALTLGIAFLPALLIATGYGTTVTWMLTNFLLRYLPGFSGMRETAKVTGMIAFIYALFFPLGIKLTVDRLGRNTRERNKKIIRACAFTLGVLLCCLTVNNIFFGFGGQLHAYPYPDSWYRVEETLNADKQTANVLFLPWHGYLEIAFANNVTASNPARVFFSAEIISGKNLDSAYLMDKSQGEWDERIAEMQSGGQNLEDNVDFLKTQSVNYIILGKIFDWQEYGFLKESARVRKVFETKEIVLYKIL